MGQWYWISEYIKLLAAYGFVLYIWPQVVFEKHLKGRRLSYRYGFCVVVMVLLVNTMVLTLGLAHCLRPWVTTAIFLGVFFWRLFVNHPPLKGLAQDVQSLHHKTMSFRRLAIREWNRIREGLSAWHAPVSEKLRGHRFEYALLLIALIFGTLYFSWGAFDEHSYGFGDQYVHHQWIHGLVEGKIFFDGIYPEAMHCMIYLTCTLFRIPIYSGVLFFAGLHVHVLLISAWLLMKEIYQWQYTALAALAMFLCFDQLCINEIFSMSRLSWTLPMEYALYSAFLSGLFLLRFLRRVMRGTRLKLHPLKPGQWSIIRDEDLFLFAGAVAVSLSVHFYVTIVAFFFCAVTAAVYFRQTFRRGSFLPMAAAALLSLFVAAAPMAAAFALGYPLQGSLYWAAGVVEGDENMYIAGDMQQEPGSAGGESPAEQEPAVTQEESGEATQTGDGSEMEENTPEPPKSIREIIKEKAQTLFWGSYNTLYPGRRAFVVLAATGLALLISVMAHIFLSLRDRRVRRTAADGELPPVKRDAFDGVLITALLSIVLMIMYNASALGFPQLVAGSRLCSSEQMLVVMLYAVPLDCLMALLARALGAGIMKLAALAVFFGVYVIAQTGGFFHSYLYFELTRYNAAVEMTNRIIDTLPPQTYTIISTTDELYQVIESGYHEELLNFIEHEGDDTYTIPTPYLLLYIEKRPIRYAQNHFADGPAWLARKEYPALYEGMGSQCPKILSTRISEKAASENILYGGKLSDSATDLRGRRILESKAYSWYRSFSAMHPRDCRVIYEDDAFMCCCITQNPGSLYTLGIMGGSAE